MKRLLLVAAFLGGCTTVEEYKQAAIANLVDNYGYTQERANVLWNSMYYRAERNTRSGLVVRCKGSIRKIRPDYATTEQTCR